MMKNYDEKCDGCLQPILAPFYSCEHCNFFLHESCAKLPRKMRHPLHVQHQLTLFAKVFHDGALQCRACYSLQWFHLYLPWMQLLPWYQMQCFSGSIGHESQKYFMRLNLVNSRDCIACGNGEAEFKCAISRFFLHFSCAMLLTIVRHRNHKHLRVLRYSPIEGEVEDPDQCICDICEYFRLCRMQFYSAFGLCRRSVEVHQVRWHHLWIWASSTPSRFG